LKEPQVLVAIVGAISAIVVAVAALAPNFIPRTPDAFIQITAQAIQTSSAATTIAQQALVAAAFTATASPTFTATPTATNTTTETYTPLPTTTNTPTDTPISPTATNTSTDTPLSPTATKTQIFIPSATTSEISATSAPTAATRESSSAVQSYPCAGEIPYGTGGMLNQVHAQASSRSPLQPPVQRGSKVTLLQSISDLGATWYQMQYNDKAYQGWIETEFVQPSNTCP
jgi:hypothetical protein